ncbi:siderophore ABC transporter substrate-binding protein [Psychromonas sp. 14N.309.X.WAT.B.A12]|uniref:siderophore ABC transporter substrate-binding protein n=1 Tax=Psychromonas sp. 14N.309.X.WAT.B.A12 TaxID=2998322 RepID=UPI0025B197F4|nr:siderophore ABC transporter substrate-binding protein [Psychromonas sp. 14N.309.X.WAT.B.A12]MDN2663525.1 siderophore ABC transporter substrate-binding protein [Psychromonas sp. 14N.309.X.WAT.B.A12]
MNIKKTLLLLLCVTSLSTTAETVSVKHNLGITTIDHIPERVVVIGVGPLDTLDYFGIHPIAVTKGTAFPPYLAQYDKDNVASSGSLFEPDFEAIYNLKPDLIIVGPRSAQSYKELSEIAPTLLYALDEKQTYWESTQTQWRNIGKLFAISPAVEKTITQLSTQISAIKSHNEQHRVDALTIMGSGGNISAFGAKSRFSAIYKDFGYQETVKNIKNSRHGDLVSYEFIRDAQPTNLFVLDRDKLVNKGKSETREQFENDLIKATPAYQNKRMIFLDINAWYLTVGGVTATQQMIKDISH